ncbi:MAG: Uncharacterized protein JWL73_493 [Actinomycetia bacterium]|nr:Uncharacterized protein [Actinomycetes bacterium]
MDLKPGTKLRSTVCTTEVVVIRAPSGPVDLACGGSPMVPSADAGEPTGKPAPGFDHGTLLGKRYADEVIGIELLCSKAGDGSLSIDGEGLEPKGAKPLPASD